MHAEAGNRAKVALESLDSTHQVHTWILSSTRPGCHVQLKGGGCTQRAFIHWWLNHTSDTLSLYSQPAEVYPFCVCVCSVGVGVGSTSEDLPGETCLVFINELRRKSQPRPLSETCDW